MKNEIREIDENSWNSFARSHPLGTVYHHSAWHRVMEESYGFRTRYHVKHGPGNVILAGLPCAVVKGIIGAPRLISYPFSDSCDPLVRDHDEYAQMMGSMGELKGLTRAKGIEVRTFRTAGFAGPDIDAQYCNFVLDLSDGTEKAFGKFHKGCIQRAIKKAEKSHLEVVEADSPECMREFYRLHIMTRKKHGVPVQPFRFFEALWRRLFPEKMLRVLLAKSGGEYVAGIVVLMFRDTAYYKFGASDEARQSLGANQLLMWRAISGAAGQGFTRFDLGKTYTGNAGLMEYKSRWGAERIPLGYVRLPARPPGGESGAMNRALGLVLKKMPAFTIRMAGEIFYKYLA